MKKSELLLQKLGKKFEELRLRSGLKTMYQGSQVLNVSWLTVNRIENICKHIPSDLLVDKILNEYLVTEEEKEEILSLIDDIKRLKREGN